MFAMRIIKLVNALPNTIVGRAMGGQLIRCGTSVGANYRAACRGRSKAEFIAKMGTVVEESDECAYWLDLIAEAALKKPEDPVMKAKLVTGRFYMERILPETAAQLARIQAGAASTMELPAEAF